MLIYLHLSCLVFRVFFPSDNLVSSIKIIWIIFFSLSYNLLSLILSSLEFVYWAFKSNDYIFHSKLSNEIVLSHVLVLFLPVFILYLFILLNKYYILHLSLRILKILEYFQNYPINFCFSLDKLTLNMIMTMLAVSLSIKLDFSIYFGILVM